MIVTNHYQQTMGCTVCRQAYEIPRGLLANPLALVQMAEHVGHDHRECSANPNHPSKARMLRQFRKRLERELRRERYRARRAAAVPAAACPSA